MISHEFPLCAISDVSPSSSISSFSSSPSRLFGFNRDAGQLTKQQIWRTTINSTFFSYGTAVSALVLTFDGLVFPCASIDRWTCDGVLQSFGAINQRETVHIFRLFLNRRRKFFKWFCCGLWVPGSRACVDRCRYTDVDYWTNSNDSNDFEYGRRIALQSLTSPLLFSMRVQSFRCCRRYQSNWAYSK